MTFRSPRIQALAAISALAAIALLPSLAIFLPECPIHRWTGLLCPGCGLTRAVQALLAGNIGESLRQNPLGLLICVAAACHGYTAILRNRWQEVRFSPVTTAFLVAIAAGFGVIRNIS